MNFTTKKPPMKTSHERSYKRLLTLHIALLIVSLTAIVTRALIPVAEGATWSPENTYLAKEFGKLNKQTYGASYDQQLVLNLFTDCIEASIVLDRDEKFRKMTNKPSTFAKFFELFKTL